MVMVVSDEGWSVPPVIVLYVCRVATAYTCTII